MDLTTIERKIAYFHSLGKVMTEAQQNIYESKYKSSHSVKSNEIWVSNISFASDYNTALSESVINSAVTLHNLVQLDEIYGSNGQSYSYIQNGTYKNDSYPVNERGLITENGIYIRPFIAPEDVVNQLTNEISNGYKLRLFRGDDATSGQPGSEIFMTEGNWVVNYYAGIVQFFDGYTPRDLGWGTIKATFFQYTGGFINDNYSNLFSSAVVENNTIVFNKDLLSESVLDLSSMLITDSITDLSFNNNTKVLSVTKYNNNNYDIDLSSYVSEKSFKSVVVSGGDLVFTSLDNTTTTINLDDIKISDSFVNATFDSNTKVLTFDKYDGTTLDIDFSSLVSNDIKDVNKVGNNLVFTKSDNTTKSISINDLQNVNEVVGVTLVNDVIKFTQMSGDVININLSNILKDNFVDVSFNTSTKELVFNKYDGTNKTINFSNYINENNFKNVAVDENTKQLIFTKNNNTTQTIDYRIFQDRSAFNSVELQGNNLVFVQQDGDSASVNLNSMVVNNGITNVVLNGTSLVFYKAGSVYLTVDISGTSGGETNSFVNAEVSGNELIFTRADSTTLNININELQDRSAFNTVEFKNNNLIFTQQDGDTSSINLSSLIVNNGITDVNYNNTSKVLTFYKSGSLYFELDLNDLVSGGQPDAFVDVDVINDKVIFTRADGTNYEIPLEMFQDRTAYNDVILQNNVLTFTQQNGSQTNIDLNTLVVNNGITDVNFDSNTNNINFYKGGVLYLTIDLNTIISQGQPDAFVDVDIISGYVTFTRADGTDYKVPLEMFQDRSAFNTVDLNGNTLIFTQQDGDTASVDLNSLIVNNGITDVTLNNDKILSFYKNESVYLNVDLGSMGSTGQTTAFVDVDIIGNQVVFMRGDGTQHSIPVEMFQDRTAFNSVELQGQTLLFTQQDGDTSSIDLSSLVINNGITDVNFDNVNNILNFYKEGSLYLTMDLETIIKNVQQDSFVDIDIIGNQVVFTRLDGSEHIVPLEMFQDRTAFNEVTIEGNTLVFTQQDGNQATISLEDLALNADSFNDASFDSDTNILSLIQRDGDVVLVDLSSLKNAEGITSKLLTDKYNINMIANDTSDVNNLACITPILKPNVANSAVMVFVNGIQVVVGNDDNCDCYFSSDNGVTKKSLTNIILGDLLYWNYVGGSPVAGYNLLSSTDKITFTYLTA